MTGVINFLKPPGMSSNGAVVFIRGLSGGNKTGHAGTLDPGASGVLPICLGKATKAASYLMNCKKEYIAEISFGISTDTGDSYGRATAVKEGAQPAVNDVKEAMLSFQGGYQQKVPAYSAAKFEGRRLYSLAREGKETPEKKKYVDIFETEYLHQTDINSHLIRVACGGGTYIRALCEDIGHFLDLPAHMSFLLRTRCAGLDINDSYTADELMQTGIEKALLPLGGFLHDMPKIEAGNLMKQLINGAEVSIKCDNTEKAAVYAGEELLGIGRIYNEMLKLTVLLYDRTE